MKVAIIGAGGVGGQLGVMLAAAGHEVSALARGAHLAAIRADGLVLRTPGGETASRLAVASDRGADLPPADLVIVAVKGQDLADAADAMADAMARGGVALPFLNGVEATEILAERFGAERVLTGIARISAFIEAPGVIRQVSEFASYTIGRADGAQDVDEVRPIRAALAEAGILAPDSPDVRVDLWKKFVMLSAFSGITAGARCNAATIKAEPALQDLFLALAGEATRLGRAEGVSLPEDLPEKMLGFVKGLPDEMRASLAHDLAAGKRLEIDWLSGAVPRLSRRHGLAAPASATIAALLQPWKEGAPAAE
jgi:2-dehydropantoate 2-reductase